MAQVEMVSRVEALEERLSRGADLLFDLEQRGETGPDYQRWLQGWVDLLREYESTQAA